MKAKRLVHGLLLACALVGCGMGHIGGDDRSNDADTAASSSEARVARSPSDDPFDYDVDNAADYDIEISAPSWVVPSPTLPPEVNVMASNNNVGITFHEGRLFFAWRTAETHFASANARMYIISSGDLGRTWKFEHTIAIRSDVREPSFLSLHGRLFFRYFEAGTNPLAFEPKQIWQIERNADGSWSDPARWGEHGEVLWDVKVRHGRAWMTSYKGDGRYDVSFRASDDGATFAPLASATSTVYSGGVSETAFELDEDGSLWAVTRNEDGDATGFGSHVAYAPADDLARWSFPARSNPERYDSPKMFRHGRDIFLVARRDVGGPFDQHLTLLPQAAQRLANLAAYSLREKRSSLYKIDKVRHEPVLVADLPGTGDTAFPSIHRLDAHTFLIANYTSPLVHSDWSWIHGQTSSEGTQIYLCTVRFQRRR